MIGKLPPRVWVDPYHAVGAHTPIPHEHSPAPLCACGHPAEKTIGSGRCGGYRCACTQHPDLVWTPVGDPIDWHRIGREAHAAAAPPIPALDPRVRQALDGTPVGGDATRLMKQFLDGWHDGADRATTAAAIGDKDTRLLFDIALALYREHGDADDILSNAQLETLHRIASFADEASESLSAPDARDVVIMAVTAIELADRHGLTDTAQSNAVTRARAHLRQ